jgi:hypothetical protein
VALFRQLVEMANRGEAVGVAYAQFACLLHGVEQFDEITGRAYGQTDTPQVLRLSARVTEAAGKLPLTWNGVTILAGMDAFIWQKNRPHARPRAAFTGGPYTETEWKTVFPDGYRRLLRPGEFDGTGV